MIYLGNFFKKIPQGLIDTIIQEEGDVTPVYQPDKWIGDKKIEEALKLCETAGYPSLDRKFYQFTSETICMQPYLDKLEWLNLKGTGIIDDADYDEHHWWFVKYGPGDMQPMHVDPHVVRNTHVIRFTMMLTDFIDGHIFVYNDNQFLKDYKAGDLFQWKDSNNYHGAANISHQPRISLQMSFVKK